MPTVLLVEDDTGIAEPLSRALQREGHEVVVVGDGHTALACARRRGGRPAGVLDLGLPDLDGLEVCRRMRASGKDVPVLMLTARTDEVDFVVGLDAGADDYVAKPFRMAELLARVRALLRRGCPRDGGRRGAGGDRGPPGARSTVPRSRCRTRSSSCCG